MDYKALISITIKDYKIGALTDKQFVHEILKIDDLANDKVLKLLCEAKNGTFLSLDDVVESTPNGYEDRPILDYDNDTDCGLQRVYTNKALKCLEFEFCENRKTVDKLKKRMLRQ